MNTILWLTMLSLVAMSYDRPAVEACPGHHEEHQEDTDEDEEEDVEVEQCKKVEEKATDICGCPGQKVHEIIMELHKQLLNKWLEVKTNVKTTNFANKVALDEVAVAKLLTKGQEIYKDMKLWS